MIAEVIHQFDFLHLTVCLLHFVMFRSALGGGAFAPPCYSLALLENLAAICQHSIAGVAAAHKKWGGGGGEGGALSWKLHTYKLVSRSQTAAPLQLMILL